MISLDIFDLDLGKLGTHATVFGGLPRKDQCFRPSQKTGGFNHRHQPRRDLAARAPRFFFGGTRGLQAVQKLLQEARDKVQLVLQWMFWRCNLW